MTSVAGELIYKGFAPTLKMILTIGVGFFITKIGMFTPPSAKGVSLLVVNVSLPALLFSSIVSAFSPSNIAAFGSLAVMAAIYLILGGILSWVIREVLYVPPDFQWGIIVTMGLGAPFNGASDVALGTAYDAVFVLFTNSAFFPLGLHKLCALDFKEENMNRPQLPFLQRWAERIHRWKTRGKKGDDGGDCSYDVEAPSPDLTVTNPETTNASVDELKLHNQKKGFPQVKEADDEKKKKRDSAVFESDDDEIDEEPAELKLRQRNARYSNIGSPMDRRNSRHSSFHSMMENTRPIPPTAPLDATDIGQSCCPVTSSRTSRASHTNNGGLLPVASRPEPAFHEPPTPAPSTHKPTLLQKIGRKLLSLFKGFILPNTIAIAIAIPCAVVLPLKALFTTTDGWTGGRMPNSPDGRPPLHFILETASFVGGFAVPGGLILLGVSIARLKTPKNWRELPLLSILAMTVMKMILLPVFGIFVVQALRDHTSLFPHDDKMRTFVSLLCSGTPAAVNQLVVTQLYNPQGSADTLAMYIALQWDQFADPFFIYPSTETDLTMPILNTALAAISLYIVT